MSGRFGITTLKKQLIGVSNMHKNMKNLSFENNLSVDAIDDTTWIISEGTGRGRTHCYLLDGKDNALLIDTGLHKINLLAITKSLTTSVVHVLNTHGHLDHITNNHEFTKIYMHPDDKRVFEEHRSYDFRSQFIINRYLTKGISLDQIQTPFIQEMINKQARLPNQVPFTPIHDMMSIDLGERVIQVLLTPGHTHGSICVLDAYKRRLYSGDSICEDGVLLHLPHSTSVKTYLHSLQKLKQHANQFETIYGGHQRVPLKLNTIDNFIACATAILQGIANPTKKESITGSCYQVTLQGATISYSPTNIQEKI